ncbi:hypothetical protein [uncultured Chitinophaga sp.]|uniref:hypothetical protein n=1 Tax=uncultured Chitinophaga sp. TaxID=339340 RepID=UPI0025FBB96A|nr:hypothetical protein [uncultured Chitinophaga sp.]
MAIVFEGFTKCPLCNAVLDKTKEYILFPTFINNKKDALFIFSDNGMHIQCLDQHPLRKTAYLYLRKYNDYLQLLKSGFSTSGEIIGNPANMITFGLLTSDSTEDLFRYNFLILDKATVGEWGLKSEFIAIVNLFNASGKWDGVGGFNYLDYLVNLVSS